MLLKSPNLVNGVCLFVAIAALSLLVAALFEASWGDIAQSTATILAASLAALLVTFQIKASGDQNFAQQRATLRLQLYKEIAQKVSSSIRPIVELSALPGNYETQLNLFEITQQRVLPVVNYEELQTKSLEKFEAVSAIQGLIEDWIALDKRLDLFRLALSCADHDVKESYTSFLFEIRPYLTMGLTNADPEIKYVFTAPSAEKRQVIRQRGIELNENCITLMAYCGDLRDQMQKTLLGELFDCSHISERQPKDARYKVLKLEDEAELKDCFMTQTAFGRPLSSK